MEKKADALPLYFLKSSTEVEKPKMCNNESMGQIRQIHRGASEPPTTHRSSVSIQRRQHPGQGTLGQGRGQGFMGQGQSQAVAVHSMGDGVSQNTSAISRAMPMYFVPPSSTGAQSIQTMAAQPNFNIKMPQRADFEMRSEVPVATSSVVTNAPRHSLPGTGMTIQLRRNSESGLQTFHNPDPSNLSVTSPTLPITTPITTSLLANLPSGSNVPASSASMTNGSGAAPSAVSMDTTQQDVTTSRFEDASGEAFSSQSGDSNFNNANLPRITSRDFSPNRGNSAGATRKYSRPKRVLKK